MYTEWGPNLNILLNLHNALGSAQAQTIAATVAAAALNVNPLQSWSSINSPSLADAASQVDKEMEAKCCECIKNLELWGHGKSGSGPFDISSGTYSHPGPGNPAGAGDWLGATQLQSRLCKEAHVGMRSCYSFSGAKGIRFASASAGFWGVQVTGYTGMHLGAIGFGGHTYIPNPSNWLEKQGNIWSQYEGGPKGDPWDPIPLGLERGPFFSGLPIAGLQGIKPF